MHVIFTLQLIIFIPSPLLWRHSSLTGFSPLLSVTVSLFLSLSSSLCPHPPSPVIYPTHHFLFLLSVPQSKLFFQSFSSLFLHHFSLLHFIFLSPIFGLPFSFPSSSSSVRPSLLHRPHSPHHRAAGLYPEALCTLWKIFPGVLQQKR